MKLSQVNLYQLAMPLVTPFVTSYGVMKEKPFYLVEVVEENGQKGYGELEAFAVPDYTEETSETAYLILKHHLLPLLKGEDIQHPREIKERFSSIRGNEMAKAAVESAVWDLYGKCKHRSLASLLGGSRQIIDVGVSIGIQENTDTLLELVSKYVDAGYTRVKLKIKPGFDKEPIQAIREKYPTLVLMADANSAYTRSDIKLIKELDHYQLAMIEQPFGVRDFLDHAWLQKQVQTRICLDENIRSLSDVQLAVALGSCKAVNLKFSRVGGLTEALEIISYCDQEDLLVWCGGMLEAGVGRAHNLALASRSEFRFPGDISRTSRYFESDIVTSDFSFKEGKMSVPNGFGIGVAIDFKQVDKFLIQKETLLLSNK
ncbi:o-succinylbenzoate synthase [Carnobacterium divergens]|uniref:o-succinylbenzoate synthase n=1 Tax=Carnobacterium divergens TaxID=2748 RepID=UPI001071D928|nr:o-succinylbenzoate synthase [Carnobacterium divergens]MDT1996206.1 o-succinylbenzoate synthase [Carnobacterium divergens]TFI70033.1 o-succinylbenzoate synthase [Carnobacterium divergens]TFI83346.1 o-succinylbenzoate synthase [Carnobacterium divergens]TFI91366.1 o-succinylbenzoate synthase [Carnobacterium divergens]TFI99569.1 o-succinylbenzoate synthase [Carnobacterium divergens]